MQVDIDHEIIIQVVHLLQESEVHMIEVVYRTIISDDEYQGQMKRCNDHVQSDIMYQVVKNGLDYRLCCDMMELIIVMHQNRQEID